MHFSKKYLKRFIVATAFFLVLIYGIASFVSYQSIRVQRALVVKEQVQAVESMHRELILHLTKVSADVNRLASDPIFRSFVSGENKLRGQVLSDWIDFMQISGNYEYISFVNLDGQEELRVNSKGGFAYSVSDVYLKNIRDSAFYQEASQVRKNHTYFSSISATKVDSNGNELNAAVSVYDFNEYKQGLFQLNYRTELLSTMMGNYAKIFTSQLMLIQEDGQVLRTYEWGDRDAEYDPNQMEISKILTAKEAKGQFETENGLYIYEHLSPVQLGEEANTRMSLTDEEWVLIAHANKDDYFFLNGLTDWQNGMIAGRHDVGRYGLIAVLAAFLFAEFMRQWGNRKEIEQVSERKIKEISGEYKDLMKALLDMLKKASKMTARQQEMHGVRMGEYVETIARHARCKEGYIQELKSYVPIHDIGMTGIRQEIISKKGELNYKEFNEIIQHVQIGYNLIKPLKLGVIAENLVLYHHERWDGNGYLYSLEADQIPLEARITAIADSYDALRMDRFDRRGMDHAAAIRIIVEGKDTKFDPKLIEILEQHQGEFYQIFERNK
jgi:HD-GYP domain-containing protein (c-di-GMP phosphodiesterase class II)